MDTASAKEANTGTTYVTDTHLNGNDPQIGNWDVPMSLRVSGVTRDQAKRIAADVADAASDYAYSYGFERAEVAGDPVARARKTVVTATFETSLDAEDAENLLNSAILSGQTNGYLKGLSNARVSATVED